MSPEVTLLQPSHFDRAADVLKRAFNDDPLYCELFPDPAERARCLMGLWWGVFGYCRVYGLMHATADVHGIACWLPPGKEVTAWRMLRTRLVLARAVLAFDRQARRRFLAATEIVDRARRQLMHSPYWYLWALGVDPEHHGRGIGSALIQPVLARADREGVPSYLEAVTEENVAFYTHRGFVVVGEERVLEGKIRVWLMARAPRR
jgi:ribosomal protein S18 acetylase RimI-like enzyme